MQYFTLTIDHQFNAMVDSVNLIERLVLNGVRSMDTYDELDRNYRHLELMCSLQDIIDDGRPLDDFLAAIALGREFTGFTRE